MKKATFQKFVRTARDIKRARGGSALYYLVDALWCSYRHGASSENYYVLRFFSKTEREREAFLTAGRSKACDSYLNKNALPEHKRILAKKQIFNKAFADYVKRDWLYLPEAGLEDFEGFLARHDCFILKPTTGTMGQGIELAETAALKQHAEVYTDWKNKKLLIEEKISQHPALNAISPTACASVRVNTVCGEAIGACLKIGGADACTDNFHSGGRAYTIDVKTGKIYTPGRDNKTLTEYYDIDAEKFILPHFKRVIEVTREASRLVDSIGYIGWDVAITETGVELIEGNFSYPGGNIIQFDDIGKYPIIKSLMETKDKND